MNKKLLLSICFSILCLTLQAQSGGNTFGARSTGMANASVTMSDEWSGFNNIGALAGVDRQYAGFGYGNRFGLEGWNTIGASFVSPMSFGGVAGLGVWRFGDNLYNENRVSLGYSHKLYGVSLGLQANYFAVSIEGLGTKQMLILEFGGLVQLSDKLFMGMHIYNFNQAKLNDFEDERVPTTMRAGISYRPVEKLLVNIETEKNIDYDPSFRAGVSYELFAEKVFVRTGISTQPFKNYYGLSLKHKNFHFDYALSTHNKLGTSHQLSLSYHLKAKKQKEDTTESTSVH
jgi:hypothetical protein